MGFESMPTGKPQKAEEEVVAARLENERQFEKQAETRNENRSFVKKIFGQGEMSAVDIAHEEALRVNEVAGERQSYTQETSQEAADQTLRSPEFQAKDEAQIIDEEAARKFAPGFVAALERGDFKAAREERSKAKTLKGAEHSVYDGMEALYHQRIESAITSHNTQELLNLVESANYPVHEIGLDTLAKMPREIIQNETLQENLTGYLDGLIVNARDPEGSVKLSREMLAKGLISPEQVKEKYSSKEVQDKLRHNISGILVNARQPKESYKKALDYINMGLMTREAVHEVMQSPDVQRYIENEIKGTVQNARDPQGAARKLGEYVAMGFLTKEKAEQMRKEQRL